MLPKIYFDTELYYRNMNNAEIQEKIIYIRTSHNHEHITGFTYLTEHIREVKKIYEQWAKAYFLLLDLKQKYNLDFLEFKLLDINYIAERVIIYINGREYIINDLNLSHIELNFNKKDVILLSNILYQMYNEMKIIPDEFISLIIGENDGKHNNCITSKKFIN